ncbi:RNI-like protein [Laetiporus sulphureus 93-53]|uniref:RNI-like protein n=1 Tax=Laetiporus sulphureus 93-53 TaxID=1314785 RepID=A0A165F800_9APHY|nr:RNI-like protein [Laetiporus sulphureus 93-53]KZT08566.1 RNI-like protein [Laetiporus sulphureus 93-53]
MDAVTDSEAGPSSGKGKARAISPSLPPLSFVTTELNYESADWPTIDFSTSVPGSSSYGSAYASGFGSVVDPEPSPTGSSSRGIIASLGNEVLTDNNEAPSRRRTLSDLSTTSKRSMSAMSITKVKVKLSGAKGPANIARKLLSKKRDSTPGSPTTSDSKHIVIDTEVPGCVDASQAHCFSPWVHDVKPKVSPVASPLETEAGDTAYPFYYAGRPSDNSLLRSKARSYSSPLPLPSTALDLIPITTTDIFKPIPIVLPNHFDEYLPSELKLRVLVSLVELHEAEHSKHIDDGKWTVRKAVSHRNIWVGRDKGVRELFKLSRVSKAWRALVFDGQLWAKVDLRSFPKLPPTVLTQLSTTAGSFIRQLLFDGYADLTALTLIDVTDHLCIVKPHNGPAHTNITTMNLHGCLGITSYSLHYLLTHSPHLRHLCVKGLSAVTNTTCEVVAKYCPKLVSLNMSRCPNMSGDGILTLTSPTISFGEPLPLKELRLSGLRRVSDEVMASLAKAARDLEVLDLSYCRDLHNSAIEAFVACPKGDPARCEVVQLTSREAGRDPSDGTIHTRRVTRLRHVNLSSCIMLTDHACSHLAHAVPKLEFLELAGIGAELKDDGLVRLLCTTPFIRRLDLEDACEITDDLLLAITPDSSVDTRFLGAPASPQPGHALEHLTISYASEVTTEAMLALVCNCTRLRVLEADSTRISGTIVREFVRLAQEREIKNAQVVAIDCRGVSEETVKDLSNQTRPRIGWRSFEARKLGFLDARDEEELSVGQDECDERRVALKTFFSWQTVDAVRAAREKKRKTSKRAANGSSSSVADELAGSFAGRARWWQPSGRRSGRTSPVIVDLNNDREGCTIM